MKKAELLKYLKSLPGEKFVSEVAKFAAEERKSSESRNFLPKADHKTSQKPRESIKVLSISNMAPVISNFIISPSKNNLI